jgi:hypothetical protein
MEFLVSHKEHMVNKSVMAVSNPDLIAMVLSPSVPMPGPFAKTQYSINDINMGMVFYVSSPCIISSEAESFH